MAVGVSVGRNTWLGGSIGFQLLYLTCVGANACSMLMLAIKVDVIWHVEMRWFAVECVSLGAYIPVSDVM